VEGSGVPAEPHEGVDPKVGGGEGVLEGVAGPGAPIGGSRESRVERMRPHPLAGPGTPRGTIGGGGLSRGMAGPGAPIGRGGLVCMNGGCRPQMRYRGLDEDWSLRQAHRS